MLIRLAPGGRELSQGSRSNLIQANTSDAEDAAGEMSASDSDDSGESESEDEEPPAKRTRIKIERESPDMSSILTEPKLLAMLEWSSSSSLSSPR